MTITEKINYVNESVFEFEDGTEIPLYDQDTIHALAGALDIEVPL